MWPSGDYQTLVHGYRARLFSPDAADLQELKERTELPTMRNLDGSGEAVTDRVKEHGL